MNGYEKMIKTTEKHTLYPSLDSRDDVKLNFWRQYHQNRFWNHYVGTSGNSCPSCASLDYEVNERELYAIGKEEPAHVHVWYSCNDCGQKWVNEDLENGDNDE